MAHIHEKIDFTVAIFLVRQRKVLLRALQEIPAHQPQAGAGSRP
jgi:hypothetical protein